VLVDLEVETPVEDSFPLLTRPRANCQRTPCDCAVALLHFLSWLAQVKEEVLDSSLLPSPASGNASSRTIWKAILAADMVVCNEL
jgi:hypothetical protein